MLYQSPEEAADDIVRQGMEDRLNTDENRAIDPVHKFHEQLACNEPDKPFLLESTMARVVAVGALIAVIVIVFVTVAVLTAL